MADRTVIFLDCGNIDRMPVDFLSDGRQLHDQHRPPPRQHPLRRRQPGRGRRLLHGGDRLRAGDRCSAPRSPPRSPRLSTSAWSPTPASSCTRTPTPRTHRIAADLIEAGVDVDETYRRLYEHVPIEKLRLLSRALDGIQRHCDERLVARLHHRRRLRGERRRRGDDRGDHRPPALGRGLARSRR